MNRNKLSGKDLESVVFAYNGTELYCNLTLPTSKQLFNFELQVEINGSKRRFLVLDDYGNDYLSSSFVKNVLMTKPGKYTIAVDMDTGLIYIATFHKNWVNDGSTYQLLLSKSQLDTSIEYKIPFKYLSKLPELLSNKRPFYILLSSIGLISFIDRETSYSDLQSHLEFHFSFDDVDLVVKNKSYQTRSMNMSLDE